MAEDRADKSGRLIDALDEKMEQLLSEMDEQRQQIEENANHLRCELDGQKKELDAVCKMSSQKGQHQKRSSAMPSDARSGRDPNNAQQAEKSNTFQGSRPYSPEEEADPPLNQTIQGSGMLRSQKPEMEEQDI